MAGVCFGARFCTKKVHVQRTFVPHRAPSPSHPTHPHPIPPHPRLSDPELLQQRLLSSPLNLQPESVIHRNPILIEFGSESAAIHRKTVVIELEFGSESAAQSGSILHRNPVDIEFASQAYWQPESVIHLNPVVRRQSSSNPGQQHSTRRLAITPFNITEGRAASAPGSGPWRRKRRSWTQAAYVLLRFV